MDKEVGLALLESQRSGSAAALAFGASTASASPPAADPYGTNDYGGFRNILPPGENGFTTAAPTSYGGRRATTTTSGTCTGPRLRRGPHRRIHRRQLLQGRNLRRPARPRGRTPTRRTARNKRTVGEQPALRRRHASCATRTSASRTSTAPTARPPCSGRATRQLRTGSSSWTSSATSVAAPWPRSWAGRTPLRPLHFASAPYSEADLQTQYDNLDDVLGRTASRARRTSRTTSTGSTSTSPRRAWARMSARPGR